MFNNLHHKHIITGDLRILKDRKLCTLFTKGPNYRGNKRSKWNKAMGLTMTELTEWMREQIDKHKIPNTQIALWLEEVKKHVKRRIVDLKRKV